MNRYVDHLARGLSVVCNILDPDIIVLGGGMSNIDYIYENIDEVIKKYIFSDIFYTKIKKMCMVIQEELEELLGYLKFQPSIYI